MLSVNIISKNFFKPLIVLFLNIGCYFNLPYVVAILIKIQSFKIKSIREKSITRKNLIIFYKSGGVDDIFAAYEKKYTRKNIKFIPRFNLQVINKFFLGENFDLRKINLNHKIDITYYKFIEQIINNLFTLYNSNLEFLSFNLSYPEEIVFREICHRKKINFFVLHKENVRSKGYKEVIFKHYGDNYVSFKNLKKIAVYNQSTKKNLLKYNLVNKNKICVVGFPRGVYSIKNRISNNSSKIKTIIYFMISPYAGMYRKNGKLNFRGISIRKHKQFSWEPIINSVEKILLKVANENPNINIIFKGKTGVHKDRIIFLKNKIKFKNVFFIDGGTGHKLLKKNSLVIGLNSTAVIEAMICNLNILVPLYKKYRSYPYNHYTHKYHPDLLANNEHDLKKVILDYLNKKNLANVQMKYKFTIKHYFEKINNANDKLREFIEKN